MEDLKNKPLLEAILQIKWKLDQIAPNIQIDNHYKILLGRFYDRVKEAYPQQLQLSNSRIPEELSNYLVQYRFCSSPETKGYPLIQIGPGIVTLNSTTEYKWEDFKARAKSLIDVLYDSHPEPDHLAINNITLHFINGVDISNEEKNIYDYLRDKLKIIFEMPKELFFKNNIDEAPFHMKWESQHYFSELPGSVLLAISTGDIQNQRGIIWELVVSSNEKELPQIPNDFSNWLTKAHEILEKWFFILIEGDLLRRFKGE